MKWLSRLWAKEPEPDVAWHKERQMGHWDHEKWQWKDTPGEPYLLVSCHANKAHAEEEARWDKLNINCASSRVVGPFNHKPGSCECWRQKVPSP